MLTTAHSFRSKIDLPVASVGWISSSKSLKVLYFREGDGQNSIADYGSESEKLNVVAVDERNSSCGCNSYVLLQEVKKKSSSKLNAIAIRHHCSKATALTDQSRQRLRALLVHEESGQLVYTPLRDGEIGFVLSQPPSDLALASVLLQPLLPLDRQPSNARGTFVAKYNIVATSSCTRVLHLENGGLNGLPPSQTTTASYEVVYKGRSKHHSSASATAQSHQIEGIVRGELRKLVHEIEASFSDRVRLVTADFQITDKHRLVLVCISGVVFFSDLVHKKEVFTTALGNATNDTEESREPRRRTSRTTANAQVEHFVIALTSSAFLVCVEYASKQSYVKLHARYVECMFALKNRLYTYYERMQSISLSEIESTFLERFGAESEATLRTVDTSDLTATSSWARRGKAGGGQCPAVMKLLERRIFMLQNTLWNPQSYSFDPKARKFFH
ncbi:unnamed protein product [Phytophthora lilii]|uniref:Unnamed protein product n=1 Tax=Phytophthora lilii TaxID=2077276 RepID=A0A9W6X1D9_9STRA|nr:unnamed protein product [Phytophthora lilii]